MLNNILEVCVSADCLAQLKTNIEISQQAGARRIELCCQLSEDGLTPSIPAIKTAKSAVAVNVELLVIIRPHSRDFCYSNQELTKINKMLIQAGELDVDGVVLGVLTPDNTIDLVAMKMLMATAHKYQLKVTFHRAFDAIDNQHEAVSELADLGVSRLLASGQPWQQAMPIKDRVDRLSLLSKQINGRFELVIGGGVTVENALSFTDLVNDSNTQISLHCHSGVHDHYGNVVPEKVASLTKCQEFSC